MRTLSEILVIVGLMALTWQQSLQERLINVIGVKLGPVATRVPSHPQPVVRYVTQPASTPSGQWMWDPARRSTLDRPAYDSKDGSQRYLDAEGRKFWLDGSGVRHYDP